MKRALFHSAYLFILVSCAFVSGCAGIQSAVDPAGYHARHINRMWWLMFWTCLIVFVVVIFALTSAVRRSEVQSDGNFNRIANKVVAGAIAATAAILFLLMVADFATGRAIFSDRSSDAITIKVTGRQWWWDFEYQNTNPDQIIRTANEIHIPAGRPVKLELFSADVIHSFWVPSLNGKQDLSTGYQTSLWLQAEHEGQYRGQCAEFCGHQHAHMAFLVIVESADSFNSWYSNQRQPSRQPSGSEQQRGQQLFLTRTCVMCHQIRGTEAGARMAPDLTHLASRQYIAAETLANTRENLKRWIANPQQFKPGNRMPQPTINDQELNQVVEYLQSLK